MGNLCEKESLNYVSTNVCIIVYNNVQFDGSRSIFQRSTSPPSFEVKSKSSKKPTLNKQQAIPVAVSCRFLAWLSLNPEDGGDVPPKYRLAVNGMQISHKILLHIISC